MFRHLFGRMVTPPAVHQIYLPESVAKATANSIASFGHAQEQHEGIAYWAGIPFSNGLVITSVIVPEAKTTYGAYHTSVAANARVVNMVNRYQLQLVAQVHGHPSSWVDHSEIDDIKAFMPYEGFYSIVLPWYGSRGMFPLNTCGIYRFEKGKFKKVVPTEIERTFLVLPVAIDLRGKNEIKNNC